MNIQHRVSQLAKQRALSGFALMMRNASLEADQSLRRTILEKPGGPKQVAMAGFFMRQRGGEFEQRVNAQFADRLERAMQTMYKDLRMGGHNNSSANWALVADVAIEHQLEVGRLHVRIRGDDHRELDLINLTIAQLHGHNEVRERENPFRPFLMASALHASLREMLEDELVLKVLFDRLTDAMAPQVPAYYAAIRQEFEQAGMLGEVVSPTQAPPASLTEPAVQEAQSGAMFDHFILQIPGEPLVAPALAPAAVPAPGPWANRAAGSADLPTLADVAVHQAAAVHAAVAKQTDVDAPSEANTDAVVARLFEFLAREEPVASGLRAQLGRLYIPTLHVALLEPALLERADHPARRLLEQCCTLAASLTPGVAVDTAIGAHVMRAMDAVQADFEHDPTVFSHVLHALDRAIADELGGADDAIRACVAAITRAERAEMAELIGSKLNVLLGGAHTRMGIAEFIGTTWSRVLLELVLAEPADGRCLADEDWSGVLPELLWSVQVKASAHDRIELMRILPGLIGRIKRGLALIGCSAEQIRQMVAQLLEAQTRAMRGDTGPGASNLAMSLDAVRRECAGVAIDVLVQGAHGGAPHSGVKLRQALIDANITVALHLDHGWGGANDVDCAWLRRIHAGTALDLVVGAGIAPQRVVALGAGRLLYVLRDRASMVLSIYGAGDLLAAKHKGCLRGFDRATLFERATGH